MFYVTCCYVCTILKYFSVLISVSIVRPIACVKGGVKGEEYSGAKVFKDILFVLNQQILLSIRAF